MNKVLVYYDLVNHGILGTETGFKGLRVGDVINVDGDDCIVIKLYSFFSVMGYASIPLEKLVETKTTNYKKVYGYKEITEDNVKEISGFKFYFKELDANGKIPITIEEAERFINRNIKIIK